MPWPPDALKLAALPAAASDEHFELHLAAIEHEMSAPILIQSRADILSAKHWQEQIEPYEHQIRNLITFCRRAPVALIADDVGLGKTISAGLILNELQVRKKVRRALVLCPSVLIEQWAEELATKFGMPRIATGTGQQFDDNLRSSAAVVITTYETARDRMADVARAGFDMVVLDEAHKLRNLTGTAAPPMLARAVFDALRQRAFRYVLMLTATPVQNRVWDIYSLVACLAAAKGHQNPLGDEGQFRRRYLTDKDGRKLADGNRAEFRRHIQDYMVRTSRLTAGLSFPTRLLQTLLSEPQSHERALFAQVGAAIGGLPKIAQFSIAEALLSSPRALHKQLENMAANRTIPAKTLRELAPALAAVGSGCKLDHVLAVCRDLAAKDPASWRCLVFTRRTETQELIAERLQREGFAVGLIRGGQANANRAAIAAYREAPPKIHVLVSTDAGAVGLNLQAGNVLVNYDLPWNPMVLEQRIGRVQRIGSKFQHVLVWNLAVAGSVEDLIVARLVEKLHAVSQTLGEVEGVLEAANLEEDYEGDVGTLVTKALMGADVRVALQKAQESIERAKMLYAAEQQAVDEHLGRLDAMHDAGPKAPKLTQVAPRLPADEFCRRAFAAAGGVVEPVGPQRVRVQMPGRTAWTAVFDADDPILVDGAARLGASAYRLYEPGSADFERLAGEWRKQSAQRVHDLADAARAAIPAALAQWAAGLGASAQAVGHAAVAERVAFQGELVLRASAAVAHDRYEKLVAVQVADPAHGDVLAQSDGASPGSLGNAWRTIPSAVAPNAVVGGASVSAGGPSRATGSSAPAPVAAAMEPSTPNAAKAAPAATAKLSASAPVREFQPRLCAVIEPARVADAVAQDPDLAEFRRFYDARRAEEVAKAGASAMTQADVVQRFTVAPAAELVGARGVQHLVVDVQAEFQFAGATQRYAAPLTLVPLTGRVLAEPPRGRCDVAGIDVPVSWLEACAVSQRRALRHHLEQSPISGLRALPAHFGVCADSGRRVLQSELLASAASGLLVGRDLLQPSAVSGKLALARELVRCAFTGDFALPDEAATSAVSQRPFRRDQEAVSAVSGVRGHASEFVRCDATQAVLLPAEAARSSLSDRLVDRRLLQPSERNPARLGLADEFVVCGATNRRLLRDEAGQSALSGRWVDRDLLALSAVSGRAALPDELLRCEASGALLLPDEAARSDASGRLVDARLLVRSAASGRRLLKDEAARCDATGALVLPDELAASAISGKRVRRDELVASKLSGRAGHASEMVRCAATNEPLAPDEVAASSLSGKVVRRDLLLPSAKDPARVGLREELVECAATQRRILRDEAIASDYSGRLLDPDAAIASAASGRRGAPDEFVVCEDSGARLLPDETGVCADTGQRVDARLLATSDLSGARVQAKLLRRCPETGKRALAAELQPCSQTGVLAAPEAMATCTATNARVLARLCVPCAATGRLVRRDRAVRSDSGRIGHPDTLGACAWTGSKLLSDELWPCPLTGQRVSRSIGGSWAAQPLVALTAAGVPEAVDGSAEAAAIASALAAAGHKVRGLRWTRAPGGDVAAFFADVSTFFGLKKKHALGWARLGGDGGLLAPPAIGRWDDGRWTADG